MRNRLLMGVTVSALAFAAVPASAQVAVNAQIAVQRNQDEVDEPREPVDDDDYDYRYDANDERGYRGFGFGIEVQSRGSANEYGPYGYPERGYGGYAEWGYRNRGSSLRAAFEYGRRDGYEAGLDAARFGRFDPMRHRYYRSTRGWQQRYGGRGAYDVNYRNGFGRGYEEGYRVGRRSRRW